MVTGTPQCIPPNPQPPGPLALGQAPQLLGGRGVDWADSLLLVANTESCFSRCCEWQAEHSGTVLERTRASKA